MAKKTSKAGPSAASAPPKASNNNDFDIDDIFSGKPLKTKPAPVASSSSSKTKAVDTSSTNKAKKDKKKKKKAVGDGKEEVQAGAVNGVKGKRKAESDGIVDSATQSKKTKTTSETKPSKPSKSIPKKLSNDDDEDDEEDLNEDYTDEDDDDDEDDEPSTPKVVEVLDPSAVSRSKVKQALQPPPSRSKLKGGRREVDVEEEMFRDSRGDGPRRQTEEGFMIFKEAELDIDPEAGGTELCPFDCECCF
ncbi:hypothetical protein HD553DRAFT_326971 [Filobasidium floriforme]|uniref:uncharacterized protein n=1 Tax=Filobasidium floriforme TaxID=5210 RepID=UPI001E8EB4E8|nr:uncharacterized protein HD553DRAFT_326971 [Filobasidium floriforme]KAH8078348.1 hypothetical protein HD553DRAFT_326971 [Filobasidium floriforme]